jgi:restriction system protein
MTQGNDPIESLIRNWRRLRAQSVGAADLQIDVVGAGREVVTAAGELVTAGNKVIPLEQVSETDVALPIGPIGGFPSKKDVGTPKLPSYPDILLQASVVSLGDKVQEGHLIEGVSIAWFELIKHLERDPNFLFQISWRKLEEIIAGAYEQAGWPEVILTPRSHDRGRDVIATKPGIGSIRIIDQVKAFAPEHRVTADDVRSILGALSADLNVSKGVVTTSSKFAPGIFTDPGLKAYMPYRLELKDGDLLVRWLIELAGKRALK